MTTTPTSTAPSGATFPPASCAPDAPERLAGLAALLGDIALSIAGVRALVRDLETASHGHAIADALAVAGWMADYGARLAGDSGAVGDAPAWFIKPYTLARLGGVGDQEGGAA